MKEGYLQMKITEINDKCKQVDQLIEMEVSKIKLLEERVGTLKGLIKKLKDLDDFKLNIIHEIKGEYKDLIMSEIKSISKKVSHNVNVVLKTKTSGITEKISLLEKREADLNNQVEIIAQIHHDLKYLLEFNSLLMMKLVNKGIISYREVDELERRALKKAGKSNTL